METFTLTCHPQTPAGQISHVAAQVEMRGDDIWISYVVEGPTAALSLPSRAKPYRTDGLWRTTCFELFARHDDGSYIEFNFSPSRQWAAYRFSGYRAGMAELPLDWPPQIVDSDEGYALILSVRIPPMALEGWAIGLAAVIEEADGTKSYWALAHPPGQPDFHASTCFAATLAAPGAA